MITSTRAASSRTAHRARAAPAQFPPHQRGRLVLTTQDATTSHRGIACETPAPQLLGTRVRRRCRFPYRTPRAEAPTHLSVAAAGWDCPDFG
jgi:hypothetical protein